MMRLPRVRFTVRRLMVAVAVVAILIGIILQVVRAIRFSRSAARFAEFEAVWRENAVDDRRMAEHSRRLLADGLDRSNYAQVLLQSADSDTQRAEKADTLAAYLGRMKAKYLAAARRPWLAVEPDPPWPVL
jgi:hypothetical protein